MLTKSGCRLQIEFVERYDTVEFLVARQMRDRLHDIAERNLVRKIVRSIEAGARPVGVAQLFRRQQDHAATAALALTHKLLTFFVAGDAEECEWARVRHGPNGSDPG